MVDLRLGSIVATALLLGACGSRDPEAAPAPANAQDPAAVSAPVPSPSSSPTTSGEGRWDLRASDNEVVLALSAPPRRDAEAAIRLTCTASGRLLVNVPDFSPIGSEERLSFGSGGAVTALVADTGGDARHGGVSASAAIPGDLAALLGGPPSASYGAQTSGPHPAPPPELARSFVQACGARAAPAVPDQPGATPPPATNACLIQGSGRLAVKPLRAIGTEPFWGARIEGRCVTYSHPEDQRGTRIWTRYIATPDGGRWTGALGGRRFELATRTQPGCPDGMSDRRYPIAVTLVVNGERRTGCAEPI
jgi:uncharacterized membrane protein